MDTILTVNEEDKRTFLIELTLIDGHQVRYAVTHALLSFITDKQGIGWRRVWQCLGEENALLIELSFDFLSNRERFLRELDAFFEDGIAEYLPYNEQVVKYVKYYPLAIEVG